VLSVQHFLAALVNPSGRLGELVRWRWPRQIDEGARGGRDESKRAARWSSLWSSSMS
jgi:hypothetical protein